MVTAATLPVSGRSAAANIEYSEIHPIEGGVGLVAIVNDDTVVDIEVRRLRWEGADLHGEVRLVVDGNETLTTPWTLSRPASRRDVLALLPARTAPESQTWRDLLNVAAREVINAQRRGDHAVVQLRDEPLPPPERLYQLDPLPPVLKSMVNIWFGTGAAGKSYLALYAAGMLAQQGVRTLYCDWEMDAGEHRFRLERIFGDDMPRGLYYLKCSTPLPQMIEALREFIRKYEIGFVVVDSIVFAIAGDASGSSVANEYLQAVRTFGVGSLHLAHTTKTAANRKKPKEGEIPVGEQFPFGSVFWHNGARSTWNFVPLGSVAERDETVVKAFHRKTNTARKLAARTLVLRFDGESGPVTVATVPTLGVGADAVGTNTTGTVSEQIHAVLRSSSMSREDLKARMPNVNPDTFRKTLRRECQAGRIVEGPDGALRVNHRDVVKEAA